MQNDAEHFVFVCVFGQDAHIRATASPADAFRQWRHRFGDFLPVTAIALDPIAFLSVTPYRRLPHRLSTLEAAKAFWRTPVAPSAVHVIGSQVKRLGDKAPALLHEWQSAVMTAKEVAVDV